MVLKGVDESQILCLLCENEQEGVERLCTGDGNRQGTSSQSQSICFDHIENQKCCLDGRGWVVLKGVCEGRILCLLCENEECSIWIEWGAGEGWWSREG